MDTVNRLPNISNTIFLPSGATSRLDQVVSLVLIETEDSGNGGLVMSHLSLDSSAASAVVDNAEETRAANAKALARFK